MNPRSRCSSLSRLAPSALLVALLVPRAALAGDSFEPAPAMIDQGHCKSLGDGFYAVKGTNACIKISGYIAAGVEFASPARVGLPAAGPFAAHAVSATDTSVGMSVDTRFDTELGPSRLYVQVGRDHVQP
jgi:hypothetical protein